MRPAWQLALAVCGLGGCYQSLGAGYVQRFGAVPAGHSIEGQMTVAVGAMNGLDLAAPMGKLALAAGDWGFRYATLVGAMVVSEGDAVSALWRPGVGLVFGEERLTAAEEPRFYFGLGAEMDGGMLFELGGVFLELGARIGADLGLTGRGSAVFLGGFLALGFERGLGDLTR